MVIHALLSTGRSFLPFSAQPLNADNTATPPGLLSLLLSHPSHHCCVYVTCSLMITKFISLAKNSILNSRPVYSL